MLFCRIAKNRSAIKRTHPVLRKRHSRMFACIFLRLTYSRRVRRVAGAIESFNEKNIPDELGHEVSKHHAMNSLFGYKHWYSKQES
jgi:hypothetical protein